MIMKILILTEGGKRIGFGHIARSGALCDALEEKGASSILVVNADNSVKVLLKNRKYIILNWIQERAKLFSLLAGADMAIIDSYLAGTDLYKSISEKVGTVVCLDDNKRIRYPRGFVVNGSIYAKKLKYPRTGNVKYLLGAEYTPLGRAFWSVPEKNIRTILESVLITFGGDDLRNITPQVLKLLVAKFPRLIKRVIVGYGFSDHNRRQIKKAADGKTELIYHPDARRLRDAMLSCDIAVSAAGQTLYELARVGVPTVAVAVAENQLNNAKGWHSAGFISYAGWWDGKDLLSRVIGGINYLEDKDVRIEKSAIGMKFVDGNGCNRISNFIIDYLKKCESKNKIKLKLANRSDCKDIWLWRNCAEVRKASFYNRLIKWQEHERWFNLRIACRKTAIYIAEKDAKKIGVIRFDVKRKYVAVSVNLNPAFFGMGLGAKIIKLGTKRFCLDTKEMKPIVAEIKKDNIASRKAFSRAGYEYAGNAKGKDIYKTGSRHD